MLMSPWLPKGSVFQEPVGPYHDSQFDLSSMATTIKYLFGIPGFLTQRDAWAGSFHELLTLDQPRTDAPMHLPDAPPAHEERERRRRRRLERQQHAGVATNRQPRQHEPKHCSGNTGPAFVCASSSDSVTVKQRNQMKWFASLVGELPPTTEEMDSMDKEAAAQWVHTRWARWVAHGIGWRNHG
jgi:hypothetical protein